MKCIKCGKRYKKTLSKCPSCSELNPLILEEQTIAIEENKEDLSLTALIFNQIDEFDKVHINNVSDSKVLKVKQEMARDLLMKDSSKQFIIELTGFTLDELNTLEKELGIINS